MDVRLAPTEKWNGDFEPIISESEPDVLPLHQRAIADLFGYDPKSEGLEASMLSICTTDLSMSGDITLSPEYR